MFCKNCGKELNDGSSFCISCGTRLGQTTAQSSFGNVANAFATNATMNFDKIKKHITKKNVGIAVAVLVVLCIIGALFVGDPAVWIVKNGHFLFNKDVTVGQLLETVYDDVEWESLIADDGKTYVNATMNMNGDKVLIQFRLNDKNKKLFNVYACEVNGIPVSIDDLF